MQKLLAAALLVTSLVLLPALSQNKSPSNAFAGRWDLTLKLSGDTWPSWMDVQDNGAGTPEVKVVGRVSSVHAATDVKLEGSHLTFTTEEWFGKNVKVNWDIHAVGHSLRGTQKRETGETAVFIGVPAPKLERNVASWGKPVSLFNGKDLTGWETAVTGEPGKSPENHWKAIKDELVNESAGANIRSKRTFQDFKLHLEYNCPDDGNSGVYLRGRYEVQVEYEPLGQNDKRHGMGSIYGFLAPSVDMPRRPGQWETYDITLVGRTVTVQRNSVPIIENQQIAGITGGAINSREAEPGPLLIQGDHTGGMKYRNITIALPAK